MLKSGMHREIGDPKSTKMSARKATFKKIHSTFSRVKSATADSWVSEKPQRHRHLDNLVVDESGPLFSASKTKLDWNSKLAWG